MDWFLYDKDLCHEKVNARAKQQNRVSNKALCDSPVFKTGLVCVVAFSQLENVDHIIMSAFMSMQLKGDAVFIKQPFIVFVLNEMLFLIISNIPWDDIGASATGSDFYE